MGPEQTECLTCRSLDADSSWRLGFFLSYDASYSLLRDAVKLKTTLFGETYRFDSVRDVLNKAGGTALRRCAGGVAASSMQERVAAKQVLSKLTLGDLREHPVVPYENDAVTRISG